MDKAVVVTSITESVSFSFARSSGPGGQNVNKVNTKVFAEIPLAVVQGLTEAERCRMNEKLSERLNKDGNLFVYVQEERTQERNREIAIQRLVALVVQSCHIPKPRKRTKPTIASRERRLASKKLHGKLKALRQAKSGW